MCGRYTQHHSVDQIVARFDAQQTLIQATERYNIAPTQQVAVIRQTGEDRVLDAFQWGLIPAWAKDPKIANKMINARAETVAEKPAFRQALVRRRCLIPGDGFYEWKREGKEKQPFHIRRADGELFAFAGLWEEWKEEDGTPRRTCTIITTGPNELMLHIHNRMPAILRPDEEADWLDASLTKPDDLLPLLRPYPAEWMEAVAVSKRVNTAGVDDPTLLNSL